MAIKFCLYFQNRETCEYLTRIIHSSPQTRLVEARPLEQLPPQVNSGTNVIFLEYQQETPDLDQWIKKTAADPRNPPIYLYLHEISTEHLWKALRFGVKECFTHPIQTDDFQEALDRLPSALIEAGQRSPSRLIALMGSKGGVGTTFLTVNLAYLLAQEESGHILMMDLDLRYGQMAYFLDAKPQYTLAEVIDNLEHLDASYLQSLFFHCDRNLQFLAAPGRLEEAELVTADKVEKVLRFVKHMSSFSHILVDAGHHLDEISLRAVELADQVVLVVNQTVPALSNAKRLLEILELAGLGGFPLEIWLNSWQRKGELTLEDISRFLGRGIQGTISEDAGHVAASINDGLLLAKSAPNLGICREMSSLARHFLEEPETVVKENPRWKWLRIFKRKKQP